MRERQPPACPECGMDMKPDHPGSPHTFYYCDNCGARSDDGLWEGIQHLYDVLGRGNEGPLSLNGILRDLGEPE